MRAEVVIDPRFRGPADSANGGYTCGLAARSIDGPAEVTLLVPPPLGRRLRVERREGTVELRDGETVVARARPAGLDLELPAPVSPGEAERAAASYPWREGHPYPACFVCGPDRAVRDGLRIHPGPVAGRPLYAAPWTPDPSLADHGGTVSDEFTWCALDCPSGIVTDLLGADRHILLGRLTADLRAPVAAGEPHVVQAWPIARDGRKLHTASALLTADGDLRAVARALWIEVRPQADGG